MHCLACKPVLKTATALKFTSMFLCINTKASYLTFALICSDLPRSCYKKNNLYSGNIKAEHPSKSFHKISKIFTKTRNKSPKYQKVSFSAIEVGKKWSSLSKNSLGDNFLGALTQPQSDNTREHPSHFRPRELKRLELFTTDDPQVCLI